MLIYFDSVVIIYLLDHTGSFQARAATRLKALETAQDEMAVSDLTRLECRVKPIATADLPKLAGFDSFFTRSDVYRVALSSAAYDRATVLRATYRFKTVDALHLAAAIEAGCDISSRTMRVSVCTDIPIEILA